MEQTELTAVINESLAEICQEKGLNLQDIIARGDFNFLESGICDSMGFLQLIATLEDKLQIEIDLSEEDPELFTNYQALLTILSKQA